MGEIALLTAVTPDYLPYLAVQMLSAAEAARPGTRLNIVILHEGVCPADRRRVDALVGPQHQVEWIEPGSARLAAAVPPGLTCCDPHFLRFLAPYVFAGQRRVIYLDADTLVTSDLTPLWQTPLHGRPVAAVRDWLATFGEAVGHLGQLGIGENTPYFNSGVLLIDVAWWTEHGVVHDILCRAEQHPLGLASPTVHGFPQWDQYGFNIALAGRCRELPQAWNFFSERAAPVRIPAIIHFLGQGKPSTTRCQASFSRLFFDTLSRTPWRQWRP